MRMDIKEITLTERQRHWLEHLRACDASGKGIAGYAAAHGLDVKAMYAGKKVLVKKGVLPRTRPSRFQRAEVKGPVHGSAWRIQLPNGLSVTFSGAVDARALGTVLAAAATVD
jgi:hypothetical protein